MLFVKCLTQTLEKQPEQWLFLLCYLSVMIYQWNDLQIDIK